MSLSGLIGEAKAKQRRLLPVKLTHEAHPNRVPLGAGVGLAAHALLILRRLCLRDGDTPTRPIELPAMITGHTQQNLSTWMQPRKNLDVIPQQLIKIPLLLSVGQ